MKKLVFLLSLFLLLLFPASGLNLFLITDPMGARIIMDNAPLQERTPCLLRDIEPGKHRIEFHLEDRTSERVTVNLDGSEETTVLQTNLTGAFFHASLKGEKSVFINGQEVESRDHVFSFPTGEYSITRGEGLLVEQEYPKASLLKGVTFAFFTSLIYSGGILIDALLEKPDDFKPTTMMYTSWGATLVLGLGDLKLLLDKGKFKRNREQAAPGEEQLSPEALLAEAEDYLSAGNLETASTWFIKLIQTYPDSLYMPQALYKLSKINIVTGNPLLAVAGLKELYFSYPLPELYDKVCHTLAGLAARENNTEESREYLDAMVFLDPLFNAEDVLEYRNQITSDAAEAVQEESL